LVIAGRSPTAGHNTLSGLERVTPATTTLPGFPAGRTVVVVFFASPMSVGGCGAWVTSAAVLSSRSPLNAACRSEPDSV
jgi:hypothetical protein